MASARRKPRKSACFVATLFFIFSILTYTYVYSELSLPDQHDLTVTESCEGPHAPITIVTAFWDIGDKSKYSSSKYRPWLQSFLKSCGANLIIYTSPDLKEWMIEQRPDSLRASTIIVDKYETAEDVPCVNKYKSDYLGKQMEIDPEQWNGKLYFIWNSKLCVMDEAIRSGLVSTPLLAWVDIGSFRLFEFHDWPAKERICAYQQEFEQGNAIFEVIHRPQGKGPLWSIEYGPIAEDVIAGGIFVVRKVDFNVFYETFWMLHDRYLAEGRFVGKEQNLYAGMAYLHHDRILLISTDPIQQTAKIDGAKHGEYDPGNDDMVACKSHWFYFQQFFAHPSDVQPNCRIRPLIRLYD